MKILKIICFILAASTTNTFAGDEKAGKKVFKKGNCITCHKADGMGKAKIVNGKPKLALMMGPRISGLEEKYIIERITSIQSKTYKSAHTKTMQMFVKKLTRKDIEDVAAYVSKVLGAKSGKHKGLKQ